MMAFTTRIPTPVEAIRVLAACISALVLLAMPTWAAEDINPGGDMDHNRPEHGSLGNIGAKLADPTANVWALSFNIQAPQFYDGDLNSGSPKVGANVIFQPVLPFPLYGTGENQWKMVTRPVIPIIFTQPVPTGAPDSFDQIGGLGDIEIPLLFVGPERVFGSWIFGAGPVFEFPSATNTKLGANQYSVGPAVAFGYKTKKWTAFLYPNYFFGVGSQSDRTAANATTSKLSLLYNFAYNLPNAWQVGTNPTISFDRTASSGNQWDVPVGLYVSRVVSIGGMPTQIQATAEYSVVSPNDFGNRASFRFVVTPVIPGLVGNPIFGGK